MGPKAHLRCTSFVDSRRVASGPLVEIIDATRMAADSDDSVIIFDDESGEIVELDFRGTAREITAQLMPPDPLVQNSSRGRGRPKLGVIAREVTLLPRHWDWLNEQPGGSSVALRKLVEEASRNNAGADEQRRARDAAYRFASAMAGDRPGYEEAIRALFAGDGKRFRDSASGWPADIREHALQMAGSSLQGS